jgi:hypothetical protein
MQAAKNVDNTVTCIENPVNWGKMEYKLHFPNHCSSPSLSLLALVFLQNNSEASFGISRIFQLTKYVMQSYHNRHEPKEGNLWVYLRFGVID